MSLKDDLLGRVDRYLVDHKSPDGEPQLTKAALGALVMNDNKFLSDIETGHRSFTARTYERWIEALEKTPDELRAAAAAKAA